LIINEIKIFENTTPDSITGGPVNSKTH